MSKERTEERTEEELRNWVSKVAEYQIIEGKRFLKIGGAFREVELYQTPNYLKIKVAEPKLF